MRVNVSERESGGGGRLLSLLLLAGVAVEVVLAVLARQEFQLEAAGAPPGTHYRIAMAALGYVIAGLVLASVVGRRRRSTRALASLAACSLLGIAAYAIFFLAPMESTMREVQRIFYLHVPSAWCGFLAFLIVFIANIAYLGTRRARWDWLGVSAAEVGVAFCTVVLITGPIWAKPVWGIWWTWDARLTSTFVLWLLYVAYLVLRTMLPEADRRAMVSAVFGIFAFLDVPLVYFSIRLWRTQHPQPVIAGGAGSGLDPRMWHVFLLSWAALLALMAVFLTKRYELEKMRHEAEELLFEADSGKGAREPERAPESVR
jgi:heme exporter protein C